MSHLPKKDDFTLICVASGRQPRANRARHTPHINNNIFTQTADRRLSIRSESCGKDDAYEYICLRL